MTRYTGVADKLWTALDGIDGFGEGLSTFSDGDDPAYWVNGKQVAHFAHGGLELRLTKANIREHKARLNEDPRVDRIRSGSDWIVLYINKSVDIPFAVELALLVAAAHRAPAGALPKPVPAGAEMARRRRFH